MPRKHILNESGTMPGFHVLDYGCGPGSYISSLVDMVGEKGKIYALDIHPLAIRKVQNIISKKQLKNVQTIHSEYKTGLPDNSIDTVLLYDVFHTLKDPYKVLSELYRVLKPEGILSFLDHRMRKDEMIQQLTKDKFFRLLAQNKKTYTFIKIEI